MLKFHCLLPDVLNEMPIIRASEYTFDWINRYRKFAEDNNPNPSTLRCPSIAEIMGRGWVNRAHQDFTIETNGDTHTFYYDANLKDVEYNDSYISAHGGMQMADFRNMPKSTLNTIVKVNTPWVVSIPDGYALLTMPIPYGDENSFTAAIGTLRGIQPLNVQLYWHCLDGRVTIKKGTPLQQMILVKDEKVDYSIESVTIKVSEKTINQKSGRNMTVFDIE